MGKFLMTAVMALSAVSLVAQEKNFIDQPYIEVTGRAEMEVVPDEIYVSITIKEKDNKGKNSIDQQEREFFNQLRNLNINLETDLTVQDFSTDLQTYLLRKDVALSSKSYVLKVKDATTLGAVFTILANLQITDANILRTSLSNMDELRQQVRAAAVVAAKQNATLLAEALGQTAGKALYIQDNSYYARPYANVTLARSSMEMSADQAYVAPALDFEKIKLEHTVLVRFVLD